MMRSFINRRVAIAIVALTSCWQAAYLLFRKETPLLTRDFR